MKKGLVMMLVGLYLMPGAQAATLESGAVSVDTTQYENLYIFSGETVINAEVYGDVIVFAGNVTVNEKIHGDLTAASGELKVNADIDGDIRAANGTTSIQNSSISGDLVLASGEVNIGKETTSSGAVMITGGDISLLGNTLGTVHVDSNDLTIGGEHQGSLYLTAINLKGHSDLSVQGDLEYSARNAIDITPDVVDGNFVKKPLDQEMQPTGNIEDILANGLWIFLSTFIMGMVTLLFVPSLLHKKPAYLRKRPGSSMLCGIIFLVLIPVLSFLSILAFFTIPTVLVILLVYIAILLFVGVITSMYLGGYILKETPGESKRRMVSRLAIGSLLLALISSIPYLNLTIGVFGVMSMGAMMQTDTTYFGIVSKKVAELE